MKQPTIIIVEDESIIALSIQEMLEKHEYRVIASLPSGEEAIEMSKKFKPDLVLMDITLSGEIDGIKAAKFIRDELNIPVVFLTSHANPKTMKEADSSRPYGYLLKPVKGTDLNLTISSALKRHQVEQTI